MKAAKTFDITESQISEIGAHKQTLNLKYEFEQNEIKELGQELAEGEFNLGLAVEEKQNAVKMHNATIGALEQNIQKLVNSIRDGFEMRDVECLVQMNTPKDGRKAIKRTDTGETWFEDMTDNDYDLFL